MRFLFTWIWRASSVMKRSKASAMEPKERVFLLHIVPQVFREHRPCSAAGTPNPIFTFSFKDLSLYQVLCWTLIAKILPTAVESASTAAWVMGGIATPRTKAEIGACNSAWWTCIILSRIFSLAMLYRSSALTHDLCASW